MYAYIKGEITFKSPSYIYLETNSIGYKIFISLNTFNELEGVDRIKIYTYFQVKEDSHSLYGFITEEGKSIFIHLISVSGIGANTARVILSAMNPNEVKSAIINEDVARFNSVKGIGPKTAKRVILDLKDKIIKEGGANVPDPTFSGSSIREEAISALNALGFQKSTVLTKIDQVMREKPQISDVEELIKLTLKHLS